MPRRRHASPSSDLMQKWWLAYSAMACSLPPETSRIWLSHIDEVVRLYRLLLHCTQSSDQRHFRRRCLEAMAKSRWELMLTSMTGALPPQEAEKLEGLHNSLEHSVQH